LRLQLRKQNNITNTFLPKQHHAKPVNSNSNSASRRHSMFKGNQKIFIELLLFAASLMLQPFALFDWVILFRISRRNLLSVNATLKNFNAAWVFGRNFCQRN